jgi:histone deacetylase HOS3
MNLNEASHHEDLLKEGGKPLPPMTMEERQNGGRMRRGWKGFYGSLHDIVRAVAFSVSRPECIF